MINISGQVPPKEHNGMYVLDEDWKAIVDPDPVIAVVQIERDSLRIKSDGERKPVMKFTVIEPLTGESARTAKGWIDDAIAQRAGTPLDIPDVEEPALDLDTPLTEGDASSAPADMWTDDETATATDDEGAER